MKPRFRAEWEVSSEELCILASWFLSQTSKNSVLEELRVRRLSAMRCCLKVKKNPCYPSVSFLQHVKHMASYRLRRVPEVGARRRGDAVALRVEVSADLHRVARLALVVVVVRCRLDEKRVLAVAHALYSLLVVRHERRSLVGVHERPHPLVHRYRRLLSTRTPSRHRLRTAPHAPWFWGPPQSWHTFMITTDLI